VYIAVDASILGSVVGRLRLELTLAQLLNFHTKFKLCSQGVEDLVSRLGKAPRQRYADNEQIHRLRGLVHPTLSPKLVLRLDPTPWKAHIASLRPPLAKVEKKLLSEIRRRAKTCHYAEKKREKRATVERYLRDELQDCKAALRQAMMLNRVSPTCLC
jgi:hypothetical protein